MMRCAGGFFTQNGLDVEVLNWGGAADQLVEALATGKAEVGVGLIHRWIKPLEAGLAVKIVGSVHGGCLRLVGVKSAGVTTDLRTLKGKVIGVSDLNSPAKQFYGIHLAKKGVDIDKDIEWRVFPADLLDVAVKKGEIHAIADGDPNLYLIEKRNPGVFAELGNSATGEYAEKICCVLGAPRSVITLAGLTDTTGQPIRKPELIQTLPMLHKRLKICNLLAFGVNHAKAMTFANMKALAGLRGNFE